MRAAAIKMLLCKPCWAAGVCMCAIFRSGVWNCGEQMHANNSAVVHALYIKCTYIMFHGVHALCIKLEFVVPIVSLLRGVLERRHGIQGRMAKRSSPTQHTQVPSRRHGASTAASHLLRASLGGWEPDHLVGTVSFVMPWPAEGQVI